MRKLLIVPMIALLTVAGAPSAKRAEYLASEDARLDKRLAGLTPGKPQSCVRLRDLQGPESYGEDKLVFKISRNFVYVNRTQGSCDRIGKGDAMITKTFSSQLCRGDIVHAADLVSRFPTDTCSIGEFVPYRKAAG